MKKYVAITIQNFIQFYSMKPLIDNLKEKENIQLDIYVPIARDDWGVDKMFDEVYNFLNNNGYFPKREVDENVTYKILLEPYPMEYYFTFNYQYRLKYKYSAISAKPFPVYRYEDNLVYDAIICYSNYEAEFLNVYANTFVVGNLKYVDYEKNNNKSNLKPTILYLPTYGDKNAIDLVFSELEKLQEKFNIITKAHHGTAYLNSEKNQLNQMEESKIKYYSQETPLPELLSIADVVLSDNSGSIFEAIYSKTPVAIVADNINNSIKDFDTLQYKLVNKDVIPYSKNPEDLELIINKALSEEYKDKQEQTRKELFPIEYKDSLNSYIKVINKFLNDEVSKEYKILHASIWQEIENKKQEVENMRETIKELNNTLSAENVNKQNSLQELNVYKDKIIELQNKLDVYKYSKLYKCAEKMYDIKKKFKKN